ncbi:hypothetical protein LTR56_017510 [Elasticomyces elasticus]|nr:hypothetical protein LTR56_017510 [Elasticomyces elasticus]KAK3665090.1 hypothetical protein LTR22_004146 [Elasticomyces elasticus]KAK4931535.1 hypothetical protein LTR49_001923 [Elasticomyces elasticus]KAK5766694.1 hypothetical protein LTS12_003043 [Elasticomyces elasticus]
MAPDPASLENTANGSNAMDGSETPEQRENRELRGRVQQLEGLVQAMALQQTLPMQSTTTPRTPHYARELRGQVSRLEGMILMQQRPLPHFAHTASYDQPGNKRFMGAMAPPPMHEQSLAPQFQAQAVYAPVRYEYAEQQHSAQRFPAASEKEPPRVKDETLSDPINVRDKPEPGGERTHDLNSTSDRRTIPARTALTKQLPATSKNTVAPIQTRSPFLQDPETLNGSAGNLWTIPNPLHWGNHSLYTCTEPVEKKFLEAREKIERKWQSGVKSALPLALHKSTPYSLSLVVKLGEFADNANGVTEMLDFAHDVLTQQWEERVSKLPPGKRMFVTTVKSEADPERSSVLGVEGNVLENVYGLMLEDVERAMQVRTSHAVETAPHTAVTAPGPFFSAPCRSAKAAKLARRRLSAKIRKRAAEANLPLSPEAVLKMKSRVIDIRDRERAKQGLTKLERKAARQKDKRALSKINMAEKKKGEEVKKAQERQEREAFDMLVDLEKARNEEASKISRNAREAQADLEQIKIAEAYRDLERIKMAEASVEAKKRTAESGHIKRRDWKQVLKSKIIEATGTHLRLA